MPIGGGLGFVGISGVLCILAREVGRRLFFSVATEGTCGAVDEGGRGGAPPGREGGKGGAAARLGVLTLRAALLLSGSESYILTPPALLRSLGMPPAKRPPSWGALSMPPPEDAPVGEVGWSLLLRARLAPAGAAGRRPGTGGAPPVGGPEEAADAVLASTIGAERSLVLAFLSRVPFSMSPRRPAWGQNVNKGLATWCTECPARVRGQVGVGYTHSSFRCLLGWP